MLHLHVFGVIRFGPNLGEERPQILYLFFRLVDLVIHERLFPASFLGHGFLDEALAVCDPRLQDIESLAEVLSRQGVVLGEGMRETQLVVCFGEAPVVRIDILLLDGEALLEVVHRSVITLRLQTDFSQRQKTIGCLQLSIAFVDVLEKDDFGEF